MRSLVVAIALMSAISTAQQPVSDKYDDHLPDAPIQVTAYKSGAHDKADDSAKYVIWNKKFTFAHVGELSSILYDVEMTHEGLAHHKCAEGGGGTTERHVSRNELYVNNLIPFAATTGLDVLFKYMMRERSLAWVPYASSAYGTILHLKGGTEWATGCW